MATCCQREVRAPSLPRGYYVRVRSGGGGGSQQLSAERLRATMGRCVRYNRFSRAGMARGCLIRWNPMIRSLVPSYTQLIITKEHCPLTAAASPNMVGSARSGKAVAGDRRELPSGHGMRASFTLFEPHKPWRDSTF
jgi:hypothetical protein